MRTLVTAPSLIAVCLTAGLAGCGGVERVDSPTGPAPGAATPDTPFAYVPGAVPAGYRLCLAQDATTADGPSGAEDPAVAAGERTWIYGDLSRPDPWSGPIALVIDRRGSAQEYSAGYTHQGARPARVHGVRGRVGPLNAGPAAVAGWGASALWVERPGHVVEVALRGGSAARAIRLADRVVLRGGDPVLPAGALGTTTGVLRAPAQARQTTPAVTQLAFERLAGSAADPGDLLQVEVHATLPGEIEAARVTAQSARTVTIAGADGVVLARFHPTRGPFTVMWPVGAGRTATISSMALSGDALAQMAQSLRGVDRIAWEDYAGGATTC